MKKASAVIILAVVVAIGSFSLAYANGQEWVPLPAAQESGEDSAMAGPRCECQYPNSGTYGVKCASEGCCESNCWIEVD